MDKPRLLYPQVSAPPSDTSASSYDPSNREWVGSYPAQRRGGVPPTDFSRYSGVTFPATPGVLEPPELGLPKQFPPRVARVVARNGVINMAQLSRHTETVEIILNSLLRKGQLNQLETEDDFQIVAGGFAANRDPGVSDDVTQGAVNGISWTNKVTRKVFYCIDNTEGAADWEQIN